MKLSPRMFRKVAREEVAEQEQSNNRVMLASVANDLCDTAMSYYGDYSEQDKAREIAGNIRHNNLQNLAELLEWFELNATLNGMNVLWAENGEEACQMVEEIIEEHEVKTITKGKSMLMEEIDLANYIKSRTKTTLHEGDLEGFIALQNDTIRFNTAIPTLNLDLSEIVEILNHRQNMPHTNEASEVVDYVREFLRTKFKQADMGITGVNFAVASTGSLLLLENEGNIRWSTSAPKVHVAIMSIEKVCANLDDAFYLSSLISRNCTGQSITTYVSLLNGPAKKEEKDGPREVYVIIVDNGRSEVYLDDEFREALRCIRCGRCAVKCPVYLRIGAYPYGNPYPGPSGTVLMPLLLGLDETKHLYQACTLCGACMETCPVEIPHLDFFQRYRQLKASGDKEYEATSNIWNKMMFESIAKGMDNNKRYERALAGLRAYTKNFVTDNYIEKMPMPLASWFIARDLPEIPSQSFRAYWQEEGFRTAKEVKEDE